jgi:hypothetical protein
MFLSSALMMFAELTVDEFTAQTALRDRLDLPLTCPSNARNYNNRNTHY